jgi:UDP-galactopyranose mutase
LCSGGCVSLALTNLDQAGMKRMNLLVFSHLRWNFVFQRPQHLMTRCARTHRVFFWEEPICDAAEPFLEVREAGFQLLVVEPHIPAGLSDDASWRIQKSLLTKLIADYRIESYMAWYYTPMAMNFTRHLSPQAMVYDCMDELAGFRGAPLGLRAAEKELFRKADLVFTGGQSLYESKKYQHRAVHCFPSSIDAEFFGAARKHKRDPEDQGHIPAPRLGYCGVIDERMDLDLLAAIADLRPDVQIVMVGPVVKISMSDLPQRPNIHYLGAKDYRVLPSYLGGWVVGLLPFARNESTRFISPTKTPEYLAAGLSVVSTPIADVIEPYGREGLVEIAEKPKEFVQAVERAIAVRNSPERIARTDQFLRQMSWDLTWRRMDKLIKSTVQTGRLPERTTLRAINNTVAAD